MRGSTARKRGDEQGTRTRNDGRDRARLSNRKADVRRIWLPCGDANYFMASRFNYGEHIPMTNEEDGVRTTAEKYGARLFAGEYAACVIVMLNEDKSYDVGFVGALIECLGLLRAGDANLCAQLENDA
jgi:hypothetical protein